MLSHHKVRAFDKEISRSQIRVCIQITSQAAEARDFYSAFVLDHATILCFFEPQEISVFPRKIQKPPAE